MCFRRSYDEILRHHHSFVVRSVVMVRCPQSIRFSRLFRLGLRVPQVAIRAVPHRRDFYNRLAQGTAHDKFDAELVKWLLGLEVIVMRMKDFLERGGYGKV